LQSIRESKKDTTGDRKSTVLGKKEGGDAMDNVGTKRGGYADYVGRGDRHFSNKGRKRRKHDHYWNPPRAGIYPSKNRIGAVRGARRIVEEQKNHAKRKNDRRQNVYIKAGEKKT